MRRRLLPLFLALAGCTAGNESLMPMEVGRTWTYQVTAGLSRRIEEFRIQRRISVAGAEGYEMVSPLGVSRLAWRDGVLWVDSAANARFDPALPLVAADSQGQAWKGRLEALGVVQTATARLEHQSEKLIVKGNSISTVRSTVTIELPRAEIELVTWFREGVGIVRQEQRLRRGGRGAGERVVALQLFSGL